MLKLRLNQLNRIFDLDQINFESNPNENNFILRSSQNSSIQLMVPYPLRVEQQYLPNNFNCFAFFSPEHYKEEDIFQVFVDKDNIGRIGWIFPVQSLLSDLHAFADNKHFLRYAFVSFFKLLKGEFFKSDVIFEQSNPDAVIQLNDIYPTSTIILSLSLEKTNTISNFHIDNYLHSLYGYRYYYRNSIDENPDFKISKTTTSKVNNVRISEISLYLNNEVFIQSLYKNHLRENNHPLVQFHLLYQLVELLIEKVYDDEVLRMLLMAKEKSQTPHELLQEMQKLSTEEYRIKKLCEKYLTKPPSSTAGLVKASNSLLTNFDREKEHFADAFYQIRNVLVHNYRRVTEIEKYIELLTDINSYFERLLQEILTNFKRGDFFMDQIDRSASLAWLQYQLLFEDAQKLT